MSTPRMSVPGRGRAPSVRTLLKSTTSALFHWAHRGLRAFRRARGVGVARSLAAQAAGLPPEGLAELNQAIQRAHRMDYARHDVYLLVTSEAEVRRLQSAGKEPWTVEWIENHVRPGHVVYDIGANVGAYALVAAKCTGGLARVYAFEPGCATYASLCRNVVLNACQGSVFPLPVALTSRTGLVNFKYHSLSAGDALHTLGDRPPVALGTDPAWDQPVLGVSLDDLVSRFGFPQPNHIKLDVDGSEAEVLRGATGVLAHTALRSVMLELNDDEPGAATLPALLTAGGLRLASVTRRPDGIGPAYGLFVRDGIDPRP